MLAARWSTVLVLALVSGCGGGAPSTPAATAGPPAATQQSAGGLWFSVAGSSSRVTLMIAETGELRVSMGPPGASNVIGTGTGAPSFGYGAVTVIDNRVEGSLETRAATVELDCTVSGTVSTRVSMQLTIVCVDDAGATTTTPISFMYDSRYDDDSSLADIAGNYTLTVVNTATNTLNINGDGTLFGMYHNGARCTLNGTVSIIHSDFNLYRFDVLFSNCTVGLQYEGTTMTGLAIRNVPGQKVGSFWLLLTAVINGRLELASVFYEPV